MAKDNQSPLLKGRDKDLTVDEATEILVKFGLVKDRRGTLALINSANHNLKGYPAGNPGDKRASYKLIEKEVFDYALEKVPAVSEYIDLVKSLQTEIRNLQKQTKKEDKQSSSKDDKQPPANSKERGNKSRKEDENQNQKLDNVVPMT